MASTEKITKTLKEKGKQLKEDISDFAKRGVPEAKSTEMPKRDVTGECEGECRDRVKEGESERQAAIKSDTVKAPEDYPKAPGASKRKAPPGSMGGKV